MARHLRQVALVCLLSLSPSLEAGGKIMKSAPGYLTHRAATAADVAAGNAGFVLQDGEVPIGKPIAMTIPQFANFNDEGTSVLVVLIQAEEARGQRIAAARTMEGEIVVGLLGDFTLLGTTRPAGWNPKAPGSAGPP